jgi:hypothetical protein
VITPNDNPFAPPSYPPPTGPVFADPLSASPPEVPASPPSVGGRSDATASSSFSPAPSAQATEAHRNATIALVLALLTPILTPLSGIAGAVTGRRALRDIAATGQVGAGRARAAIWLGSGLAVIWVFAVAFVLAAMAGSRAA